MIHDGQMQYLSPHVAVGVDQALVIGLRTDPNSKRNART